MTVLTKRKNSLKSKSNSKTKKVKLNNLIKKEKEFKKKSDICHKTKCASEYKRYNELNISTAKGRDKACSSYNFLSKKYDKCSNLFYKNSGLKKFIKYLDIFFFILTKQRKVSLFCFWLSIFIGISNKLLDNPYENLDIYSSHILNSIGTIVVFETNC